MRDARDREQKLGRLLERSLRVEADAELPAACPDAETLAAWVGGGLTAARRKGTDAHVSDCARCQAALAAMARMPSGLPTVAPRWSIGRMLAWAVPLTAGAAAIALWISTQPRAPMTVRPPAPISAAARLREAQQPQQRPLTADQPLPPATPPPATSSPATSSAGTSRPATSPPAADKAEKRLLDVAPPPESGRRESREATLHEQERALSSVRDRAAAQDTVTIPPAAAPPARTAGDAAQSAGDAPRTLTESTKVLQFATRAPAAAAAAEPDTNGKMAKAGHNLGAGVAVLVLEITTPDPSIRWRITGGRLVERSTDGGSNWQKQIDATTQLTAGASPAPSVCWLVGRNALVLLSVDGHSWRRLTFPVPVDLTGVQAVDGVTASVTTADGRTFSTRDGGSTWMATPPQESSTTPF